MYSSLETQEVIEVKEELNSLAELIVMQTVDKLYGFVKSGQYEEFVSLFELSKSYKDWHIILTFLKKYWTKIQDNRFILPMNDLLSEKWRKIDEKWNLLI